MTNQLFWADEDHSTGWIGWETIPDGNYKSEKKKILGYGLCVHG